MMEERLNRIEKKLNWLLAIPAVAEIVRTHEAEVAETHKKAVAEQEASVAAETEAEAEHTEPLQEDPMLEYQPPAPAPQLQPRTT